MRRWAIVVTKLAVVGMIGTLVAFVPIWPIALLEHFRVQYVAVGVAIVAAAAALRITGWLDAAALVTLINLCTIAPDLSASTRALPAGAPLRVLLLNVHTQSTGYDDVSRLIADTHPDVVALVEVDRVWLEKLAPAVASYPQRFEHPRNDNFGLALYARSTLTATAEDLGSLLPSAVATLDVQGTPLAIVLTHPLPPVSGAALDLMYSQFGAIGARVRELGPRVVVMGDFNATPWSRPFQRLVAATGLCDSRAGFGMQATFPASSTLLRLPIDHVLTSCAIGVRGRVVERDVGSDHLPVVIDLVVPR